MTTQSNKPKFSFWLIGVLALLWNLLGSYAYVNQAYQTEAFTSMYTPEKLEFLNSAPAFITAAFAIAVFGGFLGSVALLLKKKISGLLFLLSFLGVFIQFVGNLVREKSTEIFDTSEWIMAAVTLIISFFLVWYARKSTNEGLLN